jgi:hypothetical protein
MSLAICGAPRREINGRTLYRQMNPISNDKPAAAMGVI